MNDLFFENLFTQQEDPWFINSRLSQHKRHLHAINLLKKHRPHANNILDIGCALGTFTNTLAQRFSTATITGIDISSEAIRRAKNTFPKLSFEVQALPHLIYNTESFDAIFALEVIYLLSADNQKKAFESCHGVLKKDGIMIVTASCDPTSVPNYNTLLQPINSHLFTIEHRNFTYGYMFFRFESFIIHLYDICSYFKNRNRFVFLARIGQFIIKKILGSSLLFYVFTIPARIIKRKPLHQTIVLKKI